MSTGPVGPVGPVGPQSGPTGPVGPRVHGQNTFNKFLIGMARDVPRILHRANVTRRGIRNLTR